MKPQEITEIDWRKAIVRSNNYTSATYTLSPDAHRIISVAISVIAQNDKCFTTFRIYVKKLIEFFPALLTDKNAIARVDKATDSLMWSYIKIKQKDGWIKRNLVHSCQFVKNSGHVYIDIKLDDEMLPLLIGVNGYFSAPKLENIKLFKKDQHFKLHAYFYAYLYRHSTGVVTLSELRNILDIDNKQYKLVGHLKNRLLVPSINLINKVTDINVSIKDVKEWRKIVGFIFYITKKAPPLSNNTASKKENCHNPTINDLLKEKFSLLGVNANEFSQLKAKKDDRYLAQLFTYVNYKRKHLKIASTKSYIFGVINKNPAIEDLLTPNCIVKSKQEKYKLQQKKELVIIEVQRKIQAWKEEETRKKILNYLEQLSQAQLNEIEKEFEYSVFARGLKFGKNGIDFNKSLVKIMFNNFIYKKYMIKWQ